MEVIDLSCATLKLYTSKDDFLIALAKHVNYSPMKSKLSYLQTLEMYSEIYTLLGVVEIELRRRVPDTLSRATRRSTLMNWFEVFEFDTYPALLISKALTKNGGSVLNLESKLPFGFWVRIFRGPNFETIWHAELAKVFPGLINPSSRNSYHKVSKKLRNVNKLRNRIAHFEIAKINQMLVEIEDLIYLLEALGVIEK